MRQYASSILWIYIVLLVAGGMVGFLKAGSKVSLIMAVSFAAGLCLCQTKVFSQPAYIANILLIALLVVFAVRLSKTKKFMPSGLMLALTLAALLLRNT